MSEQAETSTTPIEAETGEDDRWAVVCARERSASSAFVYAVKSTGIYCRPGCASRQPRRENTAFYDTPDLAAAAGFRPCLRCRPDGPSRDTHAEGMVRACRLIQASESPLKLTDLAAAAGFSPFHFQRLFKAAVGLTPAAYARAERSRRLREALLADRSVTKAMYEAGFNSSGRFYETATATLGMAPTAFKTGGGGETIRFAIGQCWLGEVLVAASDKGVCAIALGDDAQTLLDDLQARFAKARLIGADADFEGVVAQVIAMIEAPAKSHSLPLDIRGAAFQQRVWDALRRIPAGSTASYAQIAEAIGAPKAARAVARACATNALAMAIPCHRVVRADGGLSGYRWGVERKAALLKREKQDAPRNPS